MSDYADKIADRAIEAVNARGEIKILPRVTDSSI